MKKTMQFLFAMSILIEGQSAFAGTPTTSDKMEVKTSLVSSTRGQQFLLITVMDDIGKPLPNATVNAPCTGLKPMLTNASGIAQFALPGNCGCNNQHADISTSTCNVRITLNCSSENPAVCP